MGAVYLQPRSFIAEKRLERSNRNMPVAYCCHQCKHWWLPLSAPFGADANESRHSDYKIKEGICPRSFR